ncbi:hypothetical protein [Muricoccus aerilatus]|uniref:hypothetical protein n=1 Tax=Muricoccus aerilatus TaxID=452982 RepID=UPI0005C15B28|nr:hypothetical protein [Roseomonas aerilata]
MEARLTQAYSPKFWQTFDADAGQIASALREHPEDTEFEGLVWTIDALNQTIAHHATDTSKALAQLHRLERDRRPSPRRGEPGLKPPMSV